MNAMMLETVQDSRIAVLSLIRAHARIDQSEIIYPGAAAFESRRCRIERNKPADCECYPMAGALACCAVGEQRQYGWCQSGGCRFADHGQL